MSFNLFLQALWVVVAFMNAMTAMAALATGRWSKASKHVLIVLGCVVLLIVVRAVAPKEPPHSAQPTTAPGTTSVPASGPASGRSQPATTPPPGQVVGRLPDTLWYLLATFSPVLSVLAGVLFFFVRRRAIRSGRAPMEKRLYLVVIIGGMAIWLWSGLRPTPVIFEDRAGLYWGIKAENVTWHLQSDDSVSGAIVYKGTASIRVHFQRPKGWIIFHHVPMGPSFHRYAAIEFAVNQGDVGGEPLRVWLYGENKKPYPDDQGLVVGAGYGTASCPDGPWIVVRVPLGEFRFTESRIMGICIGKDQTTCEGDFYLDCVRLVEK